MRGTPQTDAHTPQSYTYGLALLGAALVLLLVLLERLLLDLGQEEGIGLQVLWVFG